jgi:hypothetical protein
MAGRLHDAATKMGGSAGRDAVYTRVSWRIMPILLLCYIANFIDRTNISIAQIRPRYASGGIGCRVWRAKSGNPGQIEGCRN